MNILWFFFKLERIRKGEGIRKDEEDHLFEANVYDPDDVKSKKSNKRRQLEQSNGTGITYKKCRTVFKIISALRNLFDILVFIYACMILILTSSFEIMPMIFSLLQTILFLKMMMIK